MKKKYVILFLFIFIGSVFAQKLKVNHSVYNFKHGISTNVLVNKNERMKETIGIELHNNSNTNLRISAQNTDSIVGNSGYWLNFGLGISYFGPLVNSSISYRFNKNIFTFRYLKANEFRFSPGGYEFDEPSLSFKEIGILYGRYIRNDNIVLSISGGVGFIDGTDRGEKLTEKIFKEVKLSTFSFPLKAAFKIDITNYLGIGISFVSNLNVKKNLYSGVLEVYIGKF